MVNKLLISAAAMAVVFLVPACAAQPNDAAGSKPTQAGAADARTDQNAARPTAQSQANETQKSKTRAEVRAEFEQYVKSGQRDKDLADLGE